MPRFFIRQNQIEDGKIHILGDDAHHISRSLRMAVGESITVCDMQGIEYDCLLSEFLEDSVIAEIVSKKHSENEPLCYIRLFQALPKGDKLDTVIQKAVECGVSEITPFESERCVVKIKGDAEEKKRQRRVRISEEAAKQCGRSRIPEVNSAISYKEMLDEAAKSDIVLFCYEGDGTEPLMKLLNKVDEYKETNGEYPTLSVVVGSEGGFALSEVENARKKGFLLVGLGKRILRTETAPLFVLANIVGFTELK